jgi:hypothetical protein
MHHSLWTRYNQELYQSSLTELAQHTHCDRDMDDPGARHSPCVSSTTPETRNRQQGHQEVSLD